MKENSHAIKFMVLVGWFTRVETVMRDTGKQAWSEGYLIHKGWYYSCYFNLACSGFFANISYRKYYKNDHIFAVKYNTSFTLYLK